MTSAELDDWTAYRTTRSLAARNRLAARYLHCCELAAAHFARRSHGRVSSGELLGDAVVGLLHALETFDPARRTKFSTYALRRIRGAILDTLRQCDSVSRQERERAISRSGVSVSLAHTLGRRPSTEELDAAAPPPAHLRSSSPLHADQLPAPASDPAAALARDDLWRLACRGLTPQERTAFLLYHRDGWKLGDVAARLGLSISRLSELLSTLRAQLRVTLREENDFACDRSPLSPPNPTHRITSKPR